MPSTVLFRNHPTQSINSKGKKKMNDWTQQDLAFKVADALEAAFDIEYAQTKATASAYDIESTLRSIIEGLGMQLVITDRAKFDSTLGNPFDI